MKKIILILSSALVFIDQLLKYIVASNLEIYKSVKLIPNFLYLTYTKNDGAAFSILSGNRWFLVGIGIISLILIIKLILSDSSITKYDTITYSLVIGGIIGNLIDRIIYGSVIDYIDVYIFRYNAPIFNFADSCIVIGACMLLYVMFMGDRNNEINNSRK